MSDSLSATTVSLSAADGAEVEAYLARPDGQQTRGGVVVIHHLPGFDRATKEMVRRFAELGYDAICPNLYSREAPGADPADAAATVRAQGGVAAANDGWARVAAFFGVQLSDAPMQES